MIILIKLWGIANTTKNKDNIISNVFTNSATQGIENQIDYFDKDIENQNNRFNDALDQLLNSKRFML